MNQPDPVESRPHPLGAASSSVPGIANVAVDPVCSMQVNPKKCAGSVNYEGKEYYFCGRSCIAKFQADPEKYLKPKAAPAVELHGLTVSAGQKKSGAMPSKPVADSAGAVKPSAARYICPMDPEIVMDHPDACPKCGMALELEVGTTGLPVSERTAAVRYTCPMHPEVVHDEPGACPKCGMALEPMQLEVQSAANPELADMTRRFNVSLIFSLPLLVLAMTADFSSALAKAFWLNPVEFLLATPVVFYCGWPFFQRAWKSIINKHLNMFTLIGMGVGVAWLFSAIATVAPRLFPLAMRTGGRVDTYFESAPGPPSAQFAPALFGCPPW